MTRTLAAAALAFALMAGGGLWLSQSTGTAPAELPTGAANAQAAEVDTSTIQEMVLGNEEAEVEVIEYASFTCPHCATFHQNVYGDLKANYIDTDKIKFTYREVYFDKYGMWASMIARCEPSKFFGIADLIYKGQSDWVRAGADGAIADELRKIGLIAGIDNDKLESCLTDGDKLRTLVAWYQENATADDVQSTPTFIIDGQKYSNMNYADFSAILDEKLGE
ncbi:DsbA family protein [Thalassococcus profundi]|uniref:DsbA family protein n=1 Tax=Thalassococcus profundi TaxID=2282382 RepID=A0A369TQP6_9RHOB|nr:DsbA family protein [Thalassococcus profundi]RDD67609.1 DsbA family protein [Thalassococcus profundi]